MAQPSEKSEGIEQFITALFGDRHKAIRHNVCIWCGNSADVFKDELSRKEYSISGLCQKCQDETFSPDGLDNEE